MENENQNQPNGQQNEQPQNGQQQGQPIDTPAFIKKMLETMGCQCQENPENKYDPLFKYQGESFAIRTQVGYPFVRIHDMWWYSVDMDNLDEIVRVRKAVNELNIAMPGFSVVYTMSEEEKMMGIHTMAELLMIPAIPNPVGFFQHVLGGFFQQKKNFAQCLDAIKKAEAQNESK